MHCCSFNVSVLLTPLLREACVIPWSQDTDFFDPWPSAIASHHISWSLRNHLDIHEGSLSSEFPTKSLLPAIFGNHRAAHVALTDKEQSHFCLQVQRFKKRQSIFPKPHLVSVCHSELADLPLCISKARTDGSI